MSDPYADSLALTECLREPPLRHAIGALSLPLGSHGLDAGCGIGTQSLMLAEAIGPDGHVTGIDLQASLVARARESVAAAGRTDRVSVQEGNLTHLPFEDAAFDWAWSSDCVGYGPWDTPAMLAELSRVVRPGGSINLVFWSSEQLLPGHPILEAHLKATRPGIAPFAHGMLPQAHPLRLLGRLGAAGLEHPLAETFAGSAHAPLSSDLHAALVDLFSMRWQGAEKELTAADRAEFQRLCDPTSSDFVLDSPDYYALFTLSLFRATVPG